MKQVGVVCKPLGDPPPYDRVVPGVPLADQHGQNVSGPRVLHVGPAAPQTGRQVRCNAVRQLHTGVVVDVVLPRQAYRQPSARRTDRRLQSVLQTPQSVHSQHGKHRPDVVHFGIDYRHR